jgi:hypothetical protein
VVNNACTTALTVENARQTIPDIISLQTAATDFTVGGQWKDPAYVNRMQRELREHGLEKLEDEKKLLLVFLGQQCRGHSHAQGDTCKELRHKLSAVEAFIKTHTRVETSDAETLQHLSLVTGGPHEGANISLVQHSMFAKLGGIIQARIQKSASYAFRRVLSTAWLEGGREGGPEGQAMRARH